MALYLAGDGGVSVRNFCLTQSPPAFLGGSYKYVVLEGTSCATEPVAAWLASDGALEFDVAGKPC